MSLEKVRRQIQRASLEKNDRKYFPAWLESFAKWANAKVNQDLPVDREQTIELLKSIKTRLGGKGGGRKSWFFSDRGKKNIGQGGGESR